MHGESVAAYHTRVIAYISEMLEQGVSPWEHVYPQTLPLQFQSQALIIGPTFHRPDWAGLSCNSDITRQLCLHRAWKHVRFTAKHKPKPLKNHFLIRPSILKLQRVGLRSSENTDKTKIKPAGRSLRISQYVLRIKIRSKFIFAFHL